jgi:hypothetical protein
MWWSVEIKFQWMQETCLPLVVEITKPPIFHEIPGDHRLPYGRFEEVAGKEE